VGTRSETRQIAVLEATSPYLRADRIASFLPQHPAAQAKTPWRRSKRSYAGSVKSLASFVLLPNEALDYGLLYDRRLLLPGSPFSVCFHFQRLHLPRPFPQQASLISSFYRVTSLETLLQFIKKTLQVDDSVVDAELDSVRNGF
jgi:hypothetical protein